MRRRRSVALIGIAGATLAACNAITGAHDRFLEDATEPSDDAGKHKDTGTVGNDANPPGQQDAGDAGPKITTIDIPITPAAQWSSPNLATAGYDGGTVIATFNGPHDNHPMLVPFPTQTVPSDKKYTVRARIFAYEKTEYGIFVRGHNVANGFTVFVLSSRYSSAEELNSPFLAPLVTAKTDGTNDDPPGAGVANGQGYAFEPDHTWIFQMEVDGENLHGTITREDQPSITSDMKLTDTTPAADRGPTFGFYGFQTPGAALLQLQLIY